MLNFYLNELSALLESVGERKWAENFFQASMQGALCNRRQYLERIIEFYGGAGSINDLIISEFNGHAIRNGTEAELSIRLSKLREKIYEIVAKEIRDLNNLDRPN